MRLYLIRHTPPTITAGICYGQSDVPTSDNDITALVQKLNGRWSEDIAVYSSPLSRCLKLAQRLHKNPIADQRLMEFDFGEWEMQVWEQIPRQQIEAWASDVVHYAPGGRENLLQMTTRVMAFISDLQKHAHEQAVVVCHGGVIKILSAWQQGNTSVDLAQRVGQINEHFEFASCTEVQILM